MAFLLVLISGFPNNTVHREIDHETMVLLPPSSIMVWLANLIFHRPTVPGTRVPKRHWCIFLALYLRTLQATPLVAGVGPAIKGHPSGCALDKDAYRSVHYGVPPSSISRSPNHLRHPIIAFNTRVLQPLIVLETERCNRVQENNQTPVTITNSASWW